MPPSLSSLAKRKRFTTKLSRSSLSSNLVTGALSKEINSNKLRTLPLIAIAKKKILITHDNFKHKIGSTSISQEFNTMILIKSNADS